MDFCELFKSTEKFIEFIHKTDGIHQEHEEFFSGLVVGIESKFQSLIEDKPLKQDKFVVPDIPKLKKEPKDKRESRATKKKFSMSDKNMNPSDTVILSQADDDAFRRSARIASKSKLVKESIQLPAAHLRSPPTKGNDPQILSNLPSPSLPPVKIRRTNDTEPLRSNMLKQMLDETVCTADMKQPLGSSTPTDVSENKENMNHLPDTITKTSESTDDKEPKTPVSEFNRQIKGESVKKRVEEFEKRTQAAIVSKVPVKTPDKKQLLTLPKTKPAKTTNDTTDSKSKVFVEKELSIAKGRTTRNNSKVLREQSANIKLIKEKGQDAQKKKEVIMKASAEEAKRKREERSRKVAARREAAEKEKLELALKLEKEKDEKMKLMQKQKEEKLKQELLKKKQTTRSDSYEYAIDHVLDGASSDEEERPKNPIPAWASKENRRQQLKIQTWINKEKIVYPWFFNKNLKYPKLEELFSADVKMRPRTSSAFWNTKVTFDESFPIT